MGKVNVRDLPDGACKNLLPHALSIIEEIKSHRTSDPNSDKTLSEQID
jgi:hypothetical protein